MSARHESEVRIEGERLDTESLRQPMRMRLDTSEVAALGVLDQRFVHARHWLEGVNDYSGEPRGDAECEHADVGTNVENDLAGSQPETVLPVSVGFEDLM